MVREKILEQLVELYDHMEHRARHAGCGETELSLRTAMSELGSIIDCIRAEIFMEELRNGQTTTNRQSD